MAESPDRSGNLWKACEDALVELLEGGDEAVGPWISRWGQSLGESLAKHSADVGMTRVRKVLTELKSIKAYQSLHMAQYAYKIIYLAKDEKGEMEQLAKLLHKAALDVKSQQQLERLRFFVECLFAHYAFTRQKRAEEGSQEVRR